MLLAILNRLELAQAHPTPTPVPGGASPDAAELIAKAIDGVTGFANDVTLPIVQWCGAHPKLLLTILAAVCLDNALRCAFPDYATRPKIVRFLLGFAAPLVGNFWLFLIFLAKRFHVVIRRPKTDGDGLVEQLQPQTADGTPVGPPIPTLSKSGETKQLPKENG